MALGAVASLGSGGRAEETVRWRMNSLLFPKVFGEAGIRFADTVGVLSDGTLEIESPPGAGTRIRARIPTARRVIPL